MNAPQAGEPIAVVGIGCRLPGGVTGPESLWRLLTSGVDAIGPVPGDRWDVERYYDPKSQQPGRMNAREGGFLGRADEFDAQFFGISGRVAEQMDPQQRLLLEVCWEAFEDAGIVPDALAGGTAGVFVGACSQDYGALQSAPGEVEGLGPHSATGTFMSIVSNRLSYTFDLRGPSMTIDTACSSSLVAVHLACESIRRGESELAVAGGVNLMLTPQFAIALSQASMLSPEGRSKAFDAAASGYVRGEGAGVVVLKPLSRAQFDGDRVYAVIRGSAVNQDGRTQGITVPSGESQESNFRAALAHARVAPNQVGYVEAHGTGTPVGDPIEANALGRVLGTDRNHVAYLGSIKTNIGHLEAGAGIAGLIKAALSVHHREIPASLHFRTPNPDIEFERWRMDVPTVTQPWPAHYGQAIASVNSFGFGGTNANVVVAEAPVARHETPQPTNPVALLTFSARSETALRSLVAEYADLLETAPPDLEELARNLARRRSHHSYRVAIAATEPVEAAGKLRGFLNGGTAGRARRTGGKVTFLFNGQGPQWYAMARTLLQTSPVFRAKVLECDAIAREYVGWSLLDALMAPTEQESPVHATHCLQPTMFAVQVALAELWREWGVTPDAVAGHSMGEFAAAHLSGALDLDTALKAICRRARIQEKADPTGAMMFVALGRDEALALCGDQVWLAAENSQSACTLAGRREALDGLAAELTERGVFARVLKVNCACHSQDMDPLRDELMAELADVSGVDTQIPMYSTVTGERIEGAALDAEYWWQNFRHPVLFGPAIRSMLADGYDTFVELSPHPVLRNSLKELLADHDGEVVALSTLARDKDDWDLFLGAVGELWASGAPVDFSRRYPGRVTALGLPTNPWVHERFWHESAVSERHRAGGQTHPMLKRVDAARPTWEIRWDDHRLAWVKAHDVFGSIIVPGASYVEAALAAAQELTGERCGLEFVEFERACVLDPDEPKVSRVELDPATGTFELHHRPVRGDKWVRNVHGRYYRAGGRTPDQVVDLDEIRGRCGALHKPADIYGLMNAKGYAYGPAFCGIERLHVGDGEALALIKPPRVLRNKLDGYLLHPAVLDACFQSAILHPLPGSDGALLPYTYLPTDIENVRLHGDPSTARWCHTRLRKLDSTGLSVDISVLDADGRLVAEYSPLRGKVVRQHETTDGIANHYYRLGWEAAEVAGTPTESVLTLDPSAVEAELAGDLAERLGRASYTGAYQRDVRELCAAYVVKCLRDMGTETVLPRYERAFAGFVRYLAEDGISTENLPEVDVDRLWSDVLARHPSCVWELLLLRKTGAHLRDVLVGDADPLELLFPAGSQDETEPIYQSSPIARYHNALVREAVRRFAEESDPRRTLRVLEVGGGTGGLTANVLPVLPADRCEFVFTDVSPAFAQAARDRFAAYPFLTTRTLDVESDLEAQGVTPGSFDLVLASDVVHATADLKKTLLNLQEALAPGGVLGLIEALPGNRWLDLTFGLTSGWWAFRDRRLRQDGPLLTSAAWRELLGAVGFDDVAALSEHDAPGGQTVLLARTPASEVQTTGIEVPEQVGDWVIFSDTGELGVALAQRIEAHGGRALLASPDAVNQRKLFATMPHAGVIHLGNTERDASFDVVETLQALQGIDEQPAVFVFTRGAHGHRNADVRLDGAPVWGVGLVAGLELPGTHVRVVDLDPTPSAGEGDAVWAELWRRDGEQEVVLRAGERFVRRLGPLAEINSPVAAQSLDAAQGFELRMTNPGSLDDLRFWAKRREPLGDNEIEVRVAAAGLNFLDVMTALGQVPTLETTTGYRFGAECAGTVTRVGAVVKDLEVGDDVVAVCSAQGTLASHVTLDAACVARKPEGLGFEEAASTPIVFLTAWYALRKLARVEPGERVLIHSAAGGTGLAAIQIARLCGAEVLATAGSDDKRALLRALGVEHVMDSRSLTFADEVREITGGAGVDVVLSAAAGETVDRSIACLAAYGRYVEIGKRDLLGDRRIGLRPFLRNLSFHSFDLRQLLVDRPDAVRAELDSVLKLLDAGELHALPYRVFHPSQAEAAFRTLASAKHVGKLVIAMDEHEVRVTPLPRPALSPEALAGTWLITGGCGGVGLAMASELADAGVRNLVLAGRSGASGAEAEVAELESRGVRVAVESVDIASRQAVAAMLDRIAHDMPVLKGVLHCAMVLDDALITALDRDRMTRVTGPKADGAWHLHELTADLPLEAFVLFSSATSMIGNVGQANYAAANAFLDQLAELRRAQGKPALTVNWGAVSDVGYVARHEDVSKLVGQTGMRGFTAKQAFEAMTALWHGTQARVGVLPMDWPQFFRHHGNTAPRYARIVEEHVDVAADGALGGTLGQQLRSTTGDARGELVKSKLKARVATVLGIPFDELDETMPLMDYLDSLLAVEISSWLERELGAKVTIIELMKGPSVAQLTDQLMGRLG